MLLGRTDAVARLRYDEPYRAMPMRHRVDATDGALRPGSEVSYGWRYGGRWNTLRGTVHGRPQRPRRGSEHAFITEHDWGYTRQRDGGSIEYRVEHDPWRVWSVTFVQVADWLHAYVVQNHPDEEALRQGWMEADDPWAGRVRRQA